MSKYTKKQRSDIYLNAYKHLRLKVEKHGDCGLGCCWAIYTASDDSSSYFNRQVFPELLLFKPEVAGGNWFYGCSAYSDRFNALLLMHEMCNYKPKKVKP
jgi:hypothetical protein